MIGMNKEVVAFSKHNPLPRKLLATAAELLAFSPAVVLLGPRQVRKTTLAKMIAKTYPDAINLDLQLTGDREKLVDGSGFLQAHQDRLVVAPVQRGLSMKPGATHTVDVISPMQLPWALAR